MSQCLCRLILMAFGLGFHIISAPSLRFSSDFAPPSPPAEKASTAGDALHHAQLPTSLSLAPAVSGSVRWVLEGLDLRLLLRISERGT